LINISPHRKDRFIQIHEIREILRVTGLVERIPLLYDLEIAVCLRRIKIIIGVFLG